MSLVHSMALLMTVAAPGEMMPAREDVPALALAAVQRRLDGAVVQLQSIRVKPSNNLPGFVACGVALEHFSSPDLVVSERFFVVVPGTFAVLDRDGSGLVATYWAINHCAQ